MYHDHIHFKIVKTLNGNHVCGRTVKQVIVENLIQMNDTESMSWFYYNLNSLNSVSCVVLFICQGAAAHNSG